MWGAGQHCDSREPAISVTESSHVCPTDPERGARAVSPGKGKEAWQVERGETQGLPRLQKHFPTEHTPGG